MLPSRRSRVQASLARLLASFLLISFASSLPLVGNYALLCLSISSLWIMDPFQPWGLESVRSLLLLLGDASAYLSLQEGKWLSRSEH